MAKRQKQRFSIVDDNKNLVREETKSLNLPNIDPLPKAVQEPQQFPDSKPIKFDLSPKKVSRNYKLEGDTLEKLDAFTWYHRKQATAIICEALRAAMNAIPKEEMEIAINDYKKSELYKERGEGYYYK